MKGSLSHKNQSNFPNKNSPLLGNMFNLPLIKQSPQLAIRSLKDTSISQKKNKKPWYNNLISKKEKPYNFV